MPRAVLLPALLYGVWPAIFASGLSFLAYNFFFGDPTETIGQSFQATNPFADRDYLALDIKFGF